MIMFKRLAIVDVFVYKTKRELCKIVSKIKIKGTFSVFLYITARNTTRRSSKADLLYGCCHRM